MHLSIAKYDSRLENIFRTKFDYKEITLAKFQFLLNKFYHMHSFSIIFQLIAEKGELSINVRQKLAPAISSHYTHDFIGFLAPILVTYNQKIEYEKDVYAKL